MPIPKNITREHIEKAILEINPSQIPSHRHEQHYSLIDGRKSLPPKYVISIANKFANSIELDSNDFNAVEAKTFLLKHNFNVIDKRVEETGGNNKTTTCYYLLGAVWKNDENQDQSERFIENEIWENGYDDKFADVVNGVNEGDRVAIKSTFATRDGKSMLRIKATGTVYKNIRDGRILKIKWDNRITPFDLEGYGSYRNTIQKVAKDDIEAIFKSQNKMNYYPELRKFLEQAKTLELGTSNYTNKFRELSVKVSFGKGNQARIPWIAFLNETDTVQNGIYPVYLYYKDKELLILTYGLSEMNKPKRSWNLSREKTIAQFFSENDLGSPERYGNSFVFKTYDTRNPLIEKQVNEDLEKIILIYKSIARESKAVSKTFNHKNFYDAGLLANYFINEGLSTRFISSLLTKPFVILTGLSGSGKTKLAQAFAKWICENEDQYCIVPVGADWTNREPLLGFPNALESEKYIKPETGVLGLMLEAGKNPDKPYFLILDEMNLSHVERYFADFLSSMESGEAIPIHYGNEEWDNVPSHITLPKNLFIIGTVNIDETTYMFSPKVLDRANVIEFRVTADEMRDYLEQNKSLNLAQLNGLGSDMAISFVELAKDKRLSPTESSQLNSELLKFFIELQKTGAEFGYRSAAEINRLTAVINKLEPDWSIQQIVDVAVMQKLLPKVHGSRKKLEPVLKKLAELCLNDTNIFNDYIKNGSETIPLDKIKYPISMEKIGRMYRALLENSFTSYAEA
jgi:5-methylcytosine-specific restriction enzyme B